MDRNTHASVDMQTQTNKTDTVKNVCAKDTLGGIIREKEPDDALFSPSLEYRREIKLPEQIGTE